MRRISDLLYNFHWIVPGEAARSAQAYAGFLAPFLRRRGIKGVINLRGTKPGWRWWDYETRVCAKLGVAHRDIAFNSRRLPTRATLLELLDAFDETPRPVLIKCSGGQDRTSFAAALYLLHLRGWSALAEAKRQFARWPYLHLPKQQQRWLKAFFDYTEEQRGAHTLRERIAANYQPEAFKGWLEARGLGDAFRGLHASKPATSRNDDRQGT
jgi:protein tyrosine/serine phosphatase